MTSSQGNEWPTHDTAKNRRRLWLWAGAVVLGLLAVLAFVGYSQPELLLEFANLRYCG